MLFYAGSIICKATFMPYKPTVLVTIIAAELVSCAELAVLCYLAQCIYVYISFYQDFWASICKD